MNRIAEHRLDKRLRAHFVGFFGWGHVQAPPKTIVLPSVWECAEYSCSYLKLRVRFAAGAM